MRIEKRGRYYYAYWTERGVTVKRSTRCETRAAAERVARRWELERADPTYAAAHAATIGSESAGFVTDLIRDDVRPATVSMYRQKAGHLVRCFGADAPLSTIDANLVGLYVRRRLDEGAHRSTVYKELVCLRQVLKHAVAGGRYTRDPRTVMPPRFGNRYVPRTRHLSWAELAQLRPVCSPSLWGLVALVVATGARAGEVPAVRVVGRVVTIGGTKTAGSRRSFEAPSIFAALLSEAAAPAYLGNANRDLARACRKAGVERVTMNDLRRTFGSLLVQAGVPPHLVAKLMGHTSSAMVERVYGQQTAAAIGSLVEQALSKTTDTTDAEDTETAGNRGGGDMQKRDDQIKSPQLYLTELSAQTRGFARLQSASGSPVAQRDSTPAWLREATGVLLGLCAARGVEVSP